MITMTYEQLMGFAFTNAMGKLAQTQFNVKVAYQIKKLAEQLNKERDRVRGEYLEMVKPFAVLDEAGQMKRPNGPESFELDEAKKEAYTAAEKAFGEKAVTVDRHKVMLDQLEGFVQLSAGELSALDPVLCEAPENVPVPASDNVLPMHK